MRFYVAIGSDALGLAPRRAELDYRLTSSRIARYRNSASFFFQSHPLRFILIGMICENQILMPSSLEGSEGNLDLNERLKLRAAMALAAVGLRILRRRKLHRDWIAAHPGCRKGYRETYKSSHPTELLAKAKIARDNMCPVLHRGILQAVSNLRKLRAKSRVRKWIGIHKKRVPGYGQRYYKRHHAELLKRRSTPSRKKRKTEWSKYYLRKRRREDIQFGLATRLRARISNALRCKGLRKLSRSQELLGCTFAEARANIQSQFVNGMSWDHRRSFVVDHHVPVAAFDLRDSEEAQLSFNWRNLRPMTPHDNAVKSDTLPRPLPSWLPPHIAERIVNRMKMT